MFKKRVSNKPLVSILAVAAILFIMISVLLTTAFAEGAGQPPFVANLTVSEDGNTATVSIVTSDAMEYSSLELRFDGTLPNGVTCTRINTGSAVNIVPINYEDLDPEEVLEDSDQTAFNPTESPNINFTLGLYAIDNEFFVDHVAAGKELAVYTFDISNAAVGDNEIRFIFAAATDLDGNAYDWEDGVIITTITKEAPSFNITPGAATNGKISVDKSQAKEGETVTVTATPEEGYKVDSVTAAYGDNQSIDATLGSDGKYTFTMPADDVTVNATFIPITYTVKFDKGADDAIGTMEDQVFTYGVPQNLRANAFTRTGYAFDCWLWPSVDGSGGPKYQDEESVQDLLKQDGYTLTLYAQWNKIVFVDFTWTGNDTDGYTAAVANYTYENDTTHTQTANATVTSETTDATCETAGKTVYTALIAATSSLDGDMHEDTKTVTIAALGHEWGTPVWSWTGSDAEGYSAATATFTCNNDPEHIQTPAATVTSVTTEATCEEAGKTVYTATVTFENDTYTDSKEVTIPAKNHDWQFVDFTWTGNDTDGYTAAVANYTCKNDATHKQTVNAAFDKSSSDATCETAGTVNYTATVSAETSLDNAAHEASKTVTGTALGHNWGTPVWSWTGSDAEGYSAATATFTCNNDPEHIQTPAATVTSVTTEATCEAAGETVYTATVTLEGKKYTDTKSVTIPAKTHDWEFKNFTWTGNDTDGYTAAVANYECKNDSTHKQTADAMVTSETTAATCEAAGKTVYTALVAATSSPDGDAHEESKTVTGTALGHDWGAPEWSWTGSDAEGYSAATATFTCNNDPAHTQTPAATVTSETTEATCEAAGKTVYTATVTFENDTYTDTKEVAGDQATGHAWGEPVWSWTGSDAEGYSAATATFTCANDETHVEPVNATVDKQVDPDTRNTTYTATAQFDNETYTNFKTVEFALAGIEVTKAPDKTSYKEGETFDPAGMKVMATYTDGTTEDVTDKVTISPDGALSKSDTEITVSYSEDGGEPVETTIPITVKSKSSGGSDNTPYSYDITIEDTENGDVQADKKMAAEGSTVTITPSSGEGYEVDSVTVTDSKGNEIPVTDNGDGTFSFTMPARPVSVEVTFKEADGGDNDGREPDCPSAQYKDVDPDAWYHSSVDYAIANGLMNGVASDEFAPNGVLSRAMLVTILYRAEGEPEVSGENPYTDVAEGTWYSDAVAWADANGIVKGFGDGTFGPNENITREQIAAIMMRYADYKGVDTGARADLSGYADADDISDWAYENMQWANAEGLITGRSNNMLVPQGNTTRAETAAILMRFCEKYGI